MRIEEIVSANFDNFQSFFIRLIIPFSLMNTYLTSILTRVDSTLLSFDRIHYRTRKFNRALPSIFDRSPNDSIPDFAPTSITVSLQQKFFPISRSADYSSGETGRKREIGNEYYLFSRRVFTRFAAPYRGPKRYAHAR